MFGPCMCGDFCCPSCGPAQGNSRCPVCRTWASEGCKCLPYQIAAALRDEAAGDAAYDEMLRGLADAEDPEFP